MHVEYRDLDSDYVFVNLFAGRIGQPMGYPTVEELIGRIAARTGIAFNAHMLRHSLATENDPDAPTASAEWVKHNLNRVRDSLPNGYCARPAQQDCPHPKVCGTQSWSFAPAA